LKNAQSISNSDRHRIGAEYLMPIMLTIAISIIAGVVGHVVPAMQQEPAMLMSRQACAPLERHPAQPGFIKVDRTGNSGPMTDSCM
jgi:hypothetical protein